MDKRKEKTINAIYNAFANLIREKDYDDITKKITKNNSMILDYLYRISKIEKNG